MDQIGIIYNEEFEGNSLPTPPTGGWETYGGGYVIDDGIFPPTDENWKSYFYWKQRINLDRDSITFKVLLKDVNSVFRIGRMASSKVKGFSSIAEFDGEDQSINIYQTVSNLNLVPKELLVKKKVNFAMNPYRVYFFTLSCECEKVVFKIKDTLTQLEDNIQFISTGKGIQNAGRCWDYPAFYLKSGAIKIKEFTYSSPLPSSPRVVVLGDSITEGDTLRNEIGGGPSSRWAGRLLNELSGDVAILGTAGETSSDVLEKESIINRIFKKPKYVFLAHFTNDSNFNIYYENTIKLISIFEEKGTIPVICLFPRRQGREEFHKEVILWAYGSGYKLIDFSKALSFNNNGHQTDPSLYLPDMLHPNVLGHEKMFDQIRKDLPEIFCN